MWADGIQGRTGERVRVLACSDPQPREKNHPRVRHLSLSKVLTVIIASSGGGGKRVRVLAVPPRNDLHVRWEPAMQEAGRGGPRSG